MQPMNMIATHTLVPLTLKLGHLLSLYVNKLWECFKVHRLGMETVSQIFMANLLQETWYQVPVFPNHEPICNSI